MSTRLSSTLLSRAVLGLVLGLSGAPIAGCSPTDDADDAAPAMAVPTPADSPFAAEITGPDSAEDGNEVTVTLTNTGRLPDAFQLAVEPADAASLSATEFRLGSGESVDVPVTVSSTPANIVATSVGGAGDEIARLVIGLP